MEHAQHLSGPAAAAGLAAAGLWVVGNPLHIPQETPTMEARLGPQRSLLAYAFNTMLQVRRPELVWASQSPDSDFGACHHDSQIQCLGAYGGVGSDLLQPSLWVLGAAKSSDLAGLRLSAPWAAVRSVMVGPQSGWASKRAEGASVAGAHCEGWGM